MLLPIGFALLFTKTFLPISGRWFVVASICLMLPCLLFTYTRAAWLGFLASVIFLAIFVYPELKRRRKTLLVLCLAFLICVIILALPSPAQNSYSLIKRFLSIGKIGAGGAAGRLGLWKGTLPLIAQRPFLGTGPNTFALICPIDDKAHNLFLDIATTTGLLGLCSFLWIVIAFYHKSTVSLKKLKDSDLRITSLGLLVGCLGYLIYMLFSFSIVGLPALWWIILGLATATVSSESPRVVFRRLPLNKQTSRGKWMFYFILALIMAIYAGFLLKVPQANWHFLQGMRYENAKVYELAISEYDLATALDPNQVIYQHHLARSWFKRALMTDNPASFEKAKATYEKASEINPYEEITYLELINLLLRQEKNGEAIATFKKLLKVGPTSRDGYKVYYHIDSAFEQAKMTEQARISYEKATELNPGFKPAITRLNNLKSSNIR